MSSLASISVIGRVGQDPQLKTVGQNSTQVLEFSVAVNQKKNVNGQQTETAQWFRCAVWGKQGENLVNLIRKGSLLFVQGDLAVSTYTDKNNQMAVGLDIKAGTVQCLADFGQAQQQQQQGGYQSQYQQAPQQGGYQQVPQQGGYQSQYQQAPAQQQYPPVQQPHTPAQQFVQSPQQYAQAPAQQLYAAAQQQYAQGAPVAAAPYAAGKPIQPIDNDKVPF